MMTKTLTWKRSWFSNETLIFEDGQNVGAIDHEYFSANISASLFGERYSFKGGLFSDITITDDATGEVVGEVKSNTFGLSAETKATIRGKEVVVRYTNIWQTRWKLLVAGEECIRFKGATNKGEIAAQTTDALLMILGLYVIHYLMFLGLLLVLLVLIII